jgi:hypothetical protein
VNITSQEFVVVGEEFEINLTFNEFKEDIYDIKIDIFNESNYLNSVFWNNTWLPQNRWMYNSINTSETNSSLFKIKINEDFEGIANLTIKIKSKNYGVQNFIGQNINISIAIPEENDSIQENKLNDSIPEIYLELDWEKEEITNGQEFKIKVFAFNLLDSDYDLKLWIEDEDENIISQIYDDEENKWKSGNYYLNEILNGPGNKTKKISLKIKLEYDKFEGDAKIYAKLRDICDIEDYIEVVEAEDILKEEDSKLKKDNNETILSQ